MSELKPCPFCGCEANIVTTPFNQQPNYSTVVCSNTDCRMSDQHDWYGVALKDEAIKAWNHRPNTSAIESAVLRRVAHMKYESGHGMFPHTWRKRLLAEADRIDKEQG